MKSIVKRLHPDFPDDREVLETSQRDKFFHIDFHARTLFVPTKQIVQGNLSLVDPLMDSLGNFKKMDLSCPPDWDNIVEIWDEGNEERALYIIDEVSLLSEVSVDIETRRIEYKDNKVLAIGFGTDDVTGMCITVFTPTVIEALMDLFSRKDIEFTWQNGKFDCTRMNYLLGVRARIDQDTMLMHYVGINEKRGTHGLKDLGAIYLQAPKWDDELQKFKKEWCAINRCKLSDFTYDLIPVKTLIPYLVRDVVATRRLRHLLPTLMRPDSMFIYSKLIEASNVFTAVELNGVHVDVAYMEDLEYELELQLSEAEAEIAEAAKEYWDPMVYARDTGARATVSTPFNYKSPKQLKWLLEQVLQRPLAGTDKKVMDEIFSQVGEKVPVVSAIRKMRKLSKYMDTYVQGLRNVLTPGDRVHATFNLHGTETGRLSSSEPNMQNIPRDAKIKNLFTAPEGKKLLQLDYSQAELRVLAYLSKDEFLTGIYTQDKDLHDAVAEDMFGPNFDKEQRVQAKTINFGIAYGRGPGSLKDAFGITMNEAKALIDKWFQSMPQVKEYIQNMRNLVYHSESPKTPFGRERHFAVTWDKIHHIQNEIVNFPIQSIASDCTLFSLIEIQKWIDTNDLGDMAKITISVHDSIILEIDDDEILEKQIAIACKDIMEKVPGRYLPDLKVPFKADVESGYKWGELTSCKF